MAMRNAPLRNPPMGLKQKYYRPCDVCHWEQTVLPGDRMRLEYRLCPQCHRGYARCKMCADTNVIPRDFCRPCGHLLKLAEQQDKIDEQEDFIDELCYRVLEMEHVLADLMVCRARDQNPDHSLPSDPDRQP